MLFLHIHNFKSMLKKKNDINVQIESYIIARHAVFQNECILRTMIIHYLEDERKLYWRKKSIQ